MDKQWLKDVSSLPRRYVPLFLSHIGFTIPLLVDFHQVLLTHALALSANKFHARKSPYEIV